MGETQLIAQKLQELNCALFDGLSPDDLEHFILASELSIQNPEPDSQLFSAGDSPKYLYILASGAVTIEKYDHNGKRIIINKFTKSGTLFGEVYLYLDKHPYDYSCRALGRTEILRISKDRFLELQAESSNYQGKLAFNMLRILAHKAYFLNQKLQIHSSYTLRQKIANYLLQNANGNNLVKLHFNREQFAEFIGTTRPSLSRELRKMETEGLIRIKRNQIELLNPETFSTLK